MFADNRTVTYYLKYRPRNIDELDNEGAKKVLHDILSSKSPPHALLFTGPRGIGKTSSARIVAKIVNCQNNKGITPCDNCDLCKAITKGTCVDVIEMDAASHRGIEDAKELVANIKLLPSLAAKKIYIIDEAHMLTTEASNVLLKTLEEPPSHVMFIFATTNREKIIPTILSRVMEVVFAPATSTEIVASLGRIVKGEKLKVDQKVLEQVAHLATGSFRDASKILEQLVAANSLDLESATKLLYGAGFDSNLAALASALNDKQIHKAIEIVERVQNETGGLGNLMTELTKLLMQRIVNPSSKSAFPKLSTVEIVSLVDLVITATSKVRDAFMEVIPYEIALVKWTTEHGGDLAQDPKLKVVSHKQESLPPSPSKTGKKKALIEEVSLPSDTMPLPQTVDWEKLLSTIRSTNASIETLMRMANPQTMTEGRLVIDVAYPFHKARLEEPKNRKVIEEGLKALYQQTVRVEFNLNGTPKKATSTLAKEILLN